MRMTMLLTADYASIDHSTGKLNILGAFTRIHARQFPCTHNRMAVVVKLEPEWDDYSGQRELSVVLNDEDGTELMRFSGAFAFPHSEQGVRPEFNAVLEMNNLQFPQPGSYEFVVYVDDQLQGKASVELIQIEGQ